MEKEITQSNKTIHMERLSSMKIRFLYKLMLFRIFNNYSPQDVAYLLGKKLNYFVEIEELKSLDKRMNEIINSIFKLGRICAVDMFPVDIFDDIEFLLCKMTKSVDNDGIRYQMECITHSTILFILKDSLPLSDNFLKIESNDNLNIRKLIKELIESGYFSEKREPYEVHKKCEESLNYRPRPMYLYGIMNEFTKLNNGPKLIYKYDKEDNYYYRHYYILEKK